MTRTPSPSDLLSQHAPQPAIDADLDAVLRRVQASASGQRHSRRGIRRVAVGGLVAAATVAAAVLLPAALRAPDGAAAALDQLAMTAARQPAPVVPAGSFLHLVTVETREEQPGEMDIYPRTLQGWTAADGTFWRHDTENDGSQDWFHVVPGYSSGPGPGPAFDTSPQALAALPTDTQELLDHLRPMVQGSSSTDEAVFTFLGDALRDGRAPAETQRAMIAAMARLPHIEAERTQASDGRPCLKVSHTEPARGGRVINSVCFDEATAALIEEEVIHDGELLFRSTITTREVVTEVPAEVVAKAGDPVCDDDCQAASGAEPRLTN